MIVLQVRNKAQTLHIATISGSAKLQSKGACTSRFVINQGVAMKSYSETRKDSWLWKAKARTSITRRVSTKDCWTLNDFLYIPRQQILTMVKTESETYRLKTSRKTRPWSSRNLIVFRSFVPVLREIRKGISSNLFFPSKRQTRTRKQRNWQSKESEGYNIHRVMLSCGRKRSSPSQKIQEGLTEMVSVGDCAVHESRKGSPSPSTHPFPQ
jgi:hypothetical protein